MCRLPVHPPLPACPLSCRGVCLQKLVEMCPQATAQPSGLDTGLGRVTLSGAWRPPRVPPMMPGHSISCCPGNLRANVNAPTASPTVSSAKEPG